jgi:hyperosmotically inducible periplasmic protein
MILRLLVIMVALTGSQILTTSTTQAKNNIGVYLAAGSSLENTQRNIRDKDGSTLTPGDQNGDKKDLNITTKIRKALVKDKTLSVDAQNVKIITSNRIVTLRGPVGSMAESMKLEKIANQTKDVIRVDSQLEFKAP